MPSVMVAIIVPAVDAQPDWRVIHLCAVCAWNVTPITIAPRTWPACRTSVSILVARVPVHRMPSVKLCSIALSAVVQSKCHWVIPMHSARHVPLSPCAATMATAPANWHALIPSARTHAQNSHHAHAVHTAACWTACLCAPWSVSVPNRRCLTPAASAVSWCSRAHRDAKVI